MISEQSIIDLARQRWPDAAEIHVQLHTHVVYQSTGNMIYQGVCACAIQGHNVRKQFTAFTALDLANKIHKNLADEGFADVSPVSASEVLWEAESPRTLDDGE